MPKKPIDYIKQIAHKQGIVVGARTQLMIMILCLWDWDGDELFDIAKSRKGFKREFIKQLMQRNEMLMTSYNKGHEHNCASWVKLIEEDIGIDINSYLDAIQ